MNNFQPQFRLHTPLSNAVFICPQGTIGTIETTETKGTTGTTGTIETIETIGTIGTTGTIETIVITELKNKNLSI